MSECIKWKVILLVMANRKTTWTTGGHVLIYQSFALVWMILRSMSAGKLTALATEDHQEFNDMQI